MTKNLDEFLDAPKKRSRWWWLLLPLLLVLFVATKNARPQAAVEYQTATIEQGDLAVSVTATGNLAPTSQIDVGSEISGIVAKVLVEENDQVKQGQLLAVIDTARLQDAVARSRANLAANDAAVARERATLAEAQAQLARLQEVSRLSNGQVPSKFELGSQSATVDRALAALSSARANVLAAKAQLSSDENQLARAEIRSPVAGVILKRSIDPGQTVAASFNTPSLFIIAEDLARMSLEVSIDEADVGQVKTGQDANFTVDAYPNREFPAEITRVNVGAKNLTGSSAAATAVTSANVVSYLALLSLDNSDLSLRPGMTATATITTDSARNVLKVPSAALRYVPPEPPKQQGFSFRPPQPERGTQGVRQRGIGIGSTQTIYVLEANQAPRAIDVLVGVSNGRDTVISSDQIKAGMQVVLAQKAKTGA